MIILKNSKECKRFKIDFTKKVLNVNVDTVMVDMSNTEYSGWDVTLRHSSFLSIGNDSKINVSWGCTINCGSYCKVMTAQKCNIVCGYSSYIRCRDKSYLQIGCHNEVHVNNDCIIRIDTFTTGTNSFTLGDNNILYFRKFDLILKNKFIHYGKNNVIICGDGTKLQMDKSFRQLLSMCD